MSPIEQIKTGVSTVKVRIKKPDHPFWRKLANWMIVVGGPVGETAIQLFVPEQYKKIASIAWAAVVGTLKVGSWLTVDPKLK